MAATTLSPLVKTVTVPCTVERAFELFTAEIASWWPLVSHSVGEESATGLEVQPGVGGRIVETVADGRTYVWGTVTEWDPPRRLAFTWHPGQSPDRATRVAVDFACVDGGTKVTLVHSDWADRPDGAEARGSYDTGWGTVLGQLLAAAEAEGGQRS